MVTARCRTSARVIDISYSPFVGSRTPCAACVAVGWLPDFQVELALDLDPDGEAAGQAGRAGQRELHPRALAGHQPALGHVLPADLDPLGLVEADRGHVVV